MKYLLPYALLASALILSSCATKQYTQAPAVSPEESAVFDCPTIKQEIAKCHSVQEEIDRTGDFDGRTVLGFLGDFGVGNGMAKSTAEQKAKDRLYQLESLKVAKNCR